MRWKVKLSPDPPKLGETRILKVFLWFPVYIKREIRWLEQAWIEQELQPDNDGKIIADAMKRLGSYQDTSGSSRAAWTNIQWAPRPERVPRLHH